MQALSRDLRNTALKLGSLCESRTGNRLCASKWQLTITRAYDGKGGLRIRKERIILEKRKEIGKKRGRLGRPRSISTWPEKGRGLIGRGGSLQGRADKGGRYKEDEIYGQ